MNIKDSLLIAALFLALIGLFGGLVWIFEMAWNFVMVEAFHFPELNYLQSIALFIVVGLLFGTVKKSGK